MLRIACRPRDGAYDGAPTTKAIRAARPARSPPKIVVPPRMISIPPPGQPHGGTERERYAAEIAVLNRMIRTTKPNPIRAA